MSTQRGIYTTASRADISLVDMAVMPTPRACCLPSAMIACQGIHEARWSRSSSQHAKLPTFPLSISYCQTTIVPASISFSGSRPPGEVRPRCGEGSESVVEEAKSGSEGIRSSQTKKKKGITDSHNVGPVDDVANRAAIDLHVRENEGDCRAPKHITPIKAKADIDEGSSSMVHMDPF